MKSSAVYFVVQEKSFGRLAAVVLALASVALPRLGFSQPPPVTEMELAVPYALAVQATPAPTACPDPLSLSTVATSSSGNTAISVLSLDITLSSSMALRRMRPAQRRQLLQANKMAAAIGTVRTGVCCYCRYEQGDWLLNFKAKCDQVMKEDVCKNAVWTMVDSYPSGGSFATAPWVTPPADVRCDPMFLDVFGHMTYSDGGFCARKSYQLCVSGGGSVCASFHGCLPLANAESAASALASYIAAHPVPGVTITITGSQSTTTGSGAGEETSVVITAACDDSGSVGVYYPLCNELSGCPSENETISCVGSSGSLERRICCGTLEIGSFTIINGTWTVPGVDGKCPPGIEMPPDWPPAI